MRNLTLLKQIKGSFEISKENQVIFHILNSETNDSYGITDSGTIIGYSSKTGKVVYILINFMVNI